MALRLTRISERKWKCSLGTIQPSQYQKGDILFNGHQFYIWNPKNKYQTEYRKMRSALVKFLEDQRPAEITNGEFADIMSDNTKYTVELLNEISSLKRKVQDCADAAHEERQRAMRLEDDIKVLKFQLQNYKNLLESCGYNPSTETFEQNALLATYNKIRYENGHIKKPQFIEFSNAPSSKLPRTVKF